MVQYGLDCQSREIRTHWETSFLSENAVFFLKMFHTTYSKYA
jgi:hypothetical protein